MSHKRTPSQDVKHTVNRDALLMGLYLGSKLDGIQAQQAEIQAQQAEQTRLARDQWWNSLTPAQQAAELAKAEAWQREQQAREAAGRARADVQRYRGARSNAGLLYWIGLVTWLVVLIVGELLTMLIVTAATLHSNGSRLPLPVPLAYGLAAVLLYCLLVFRARKRRGRRLEAAERLPGASKLPTA